MSGKNALRYKKCPQIVSQLVDEKEESVVWHLKEWDSTWQVLRKYASCPIDMGGNTSLLFRLSDPVKVDGDDGEEETWLSLLVHYKSCEEDSSNNKDTCFKFQVDALDDKLELCKEVLPAAYFTICEKSPTTTLVKKFIDISSFDEHPWAGKLWKQIRASRGFQIPIPLIVGITVIKVGFQSQVSNGTTPLADDGKHDALVKREQHTSSSNTQANQDPFELVRVTCDRGVEFAVSEVFFQRSSVLKELIEREKARRNGKRLELHILVGFPGEVMQIIFHWLKSREFAPLEMDRDFERVTMSQILGAAKTLELDDLVEYLDTNMASYCTVKNQEGLLHAARAFSLFSAVMALTEWTCQTPASTIKKYLQYSYGTTFM